MQQDQVRLDGAANRLAAVVDHYVDVRSAIGDGVEPLVMVRVETRSERLRLPDVCGAPVAIRQPMRQDVDARDGAPHRVPGIDPELVHGPGLSLPTHFT